MGDFEDRIIRAVDFGRRVRSTYYATIELPDEQALGAPASEDEIAELEHQLGQKLPPSYRQFLLLHNGWRMASGAMDLLSVTEMLIGSRHDRVQKRQQQEGRVDPVAASGLVVGSADITPTMLLLDPDTVDENGEWLVIRYHKGPEQTYASFLDWLEQSARDFAELVESERQR
jgi:cell wall assembly regulator SMI1